MKNSKIRGITADICIEDDKDFKYNCKAMDDVLFTLLKFSQLYKQSIKIYICA